MTNNKYRVVNDFNVYKDKQNYTMLTKKLLDKVSMKTEIHIFSTSKNLQPNLI